MPMTVVTLTQVPPSLRGDLTKWLQEISSGVYVGNINSRVRDKLWERITENVGSRGQATLSFAKQGEVGYDFKTYQTYREVIDCEGVPLVLIPSQQRSNDSNYKKHIPSKAATFHKIRQMSKAKASLNQTYVVIDIETDGLDKSKNNIIEIGALKVSRTGQQEFNELIKISPKLPNIISNLTGITDELLTNKGQKLSAVLKSLIEFVGQAVIVGYNVNFDLDFINHNLAELDFPMLLNNRIDLLKLVKREKLFVTNYKLNTILKEYGIDKEVPHRALLDAKLTNQLATKVSEFDKMLKKKR